MAPATASVIGDTPPLTWTEEFSVGNSQLDADHHMLFDLVGVLDDAPSPVPTQTVAAVLNALVRYAAGHFEREERYQKSIGFPGLAVHHAEHLRLLERVQSFRRQLAADPERFDLVALRTFLRRWLINHVLNEDMQFRWFAEGNYPAP